MMLGGNIPGQSVFFCSFYYILLQHDGGLESLFLKAGMIIPNEIIDWFRSVFADANRRLAEKMLNVPSIPEPHLDTTFVEHLMSFATPRKFKGDWAIRIDTHYIGGLAQYWSWEIADIGVFVFFQRKGQLVRQKVALLQSKRLYPIVGDVVELEDFDYMIGMARLGARQGPQAAIIADRIFRFTMSSGYQALQPGSEQTKHIGEFIKRREIPVFYLFYNPPRTPLRVVVASCPRPRSSNCWIRSKRFQPSRNLMIFSIPRSQLFILVVGASSIS
jgi:hypothetical protein